MSAQDFDAVAVVVATPPYDPTDTLRIVNISYGFVLRASDLVRTLSPNNPHDYSVIQGFLYAPTLPPSSPCDNATRALIPSNVTTLADLPYGHSSLIALAPWTEPACVQSYLSVMASDGVRGAIFFHPGNDSQQPPPVSDPSWSLNDGGQWKSTNQYPVYAIPGSLGAFLLHELALYSGNMSQAPFGEELVTIYDPHDTVRLYGRLDINTAGGIPSLWIFLIIVLAILLSVVLTTSVIMHWIQRKQRQRLQQRVANGEVDLEVLGIKRLKVPQDILDTMPQYPYTLPTQVGNDEKSTAGKVAEPEDKDHANGAASDAGHEVAFHQPTCPICLDDFVAGETTVRELPCKHIYHPECIDPFLRDSSSLCPMCKKTTLPAGYCPVQVTNIMLPDHVRTGVTGVSMENGLSCNRYRPAEDSRRILKFQPKFEHKAYPPQEHGGEKRLHASKPQHMISRQTRHVLQMCRGLCGAESLVASSPALNNV